MTPKMFSRHLAKTPSHIPNLSASGSSASIPSEGSPLTISDISTPPSLAPPPFTLGSATSELVRALALRGEKTGAAVGPTKI